MKYVVAPKKNHLKLLNTLRKNDPFLDIKLMSKEDLENAFLYKANINSLIYLMVEHHYSYEVAKAIILKSIR